MKGLSETILITMAGGIGGAFMYRVIGGVEIAVLGTAVGINFWGFIIIGACVSSTGYGMFRLGKGRKAGEK